MTNNIFSDIIPGSTLWSIQLGPCTLEGYNEINVYHYASDRVQYDSSIIKVLLMKGSDRALRYYSTNGFLISEHYDELRGRKNYELFDHHRSLFFKNPFENNSTDVTPQQAMEAIQKFLNL